jgi:predicted ArsR family transcriptional regulator
VGASPGLSATEFASAVTAITSAFGDPTRRDIYLWLRDRAEGATASEVAEAFELHANVARHHLDKLTGGGYVEVTVARPDGSKRAGRPSKRYVVRAEGEQIEFPTRHDDLLITLLGKALALLPRDQAELMAEEVGLEYGRTLARSMGPSDAQRSFRSALHAVADALTAHGFAAHAEKAVGADGDDELRIVASHCPFGGAAIEHPVICAVDRGLVKGMLATLYGTTSAETAATVPTGSETCVTVVINA